MTAAQAKIYREALQRSKKVLAATSEWSMDTTTDNGSEVSATNRGKQPKKTALLPKDSSTNVLMDLRKAASHAMLFRRGFTDEIILAMAKVLVKQPDFVKRGATLQFVREDMEVMTDSELQVFCSQHKVCV